MSWNDEKHQAMRKWAVHPDQNYRDPEELIKRTKGSSHVQYRSKSCMKAYQRIEKIYDECMRDKAHAKARQMQERAKNAPKS